MWNSIQLISEMQLNSEQILFCRKVKQITMDNLILTCTYNKHMNIMKQMNNTPIITKKKSIYDGNNNNDDD